MQKAKKYDSENTSNMLQKHKSIRNVREQNESFENIKT